MRAHKKLIEAGAAQVSEYETVALAKANTPDGWGRIGKITFSPKDITVPDLSDAPDAFLSDAKAQAQRAVIAFANSITAQITSKVPEDEVRSWPDQAREAQIIIEGGTAADAPLLSLLAADAKVPMADYAARVLQNAAAYRQIVAAVKSVRSLAEAGIEAATTPEEVQAALDAAKAAAMARAQALGLA